MPTGLALFFDLVRAETRWFEQLDGDLFAEHGVHMASYDVLQVIDSIEGCRVQDIVREIGITVGAVSKSVDRLERDGWAQRVANPADRRSSLITLTDAGTELLGRATPFVNAAVEARLASIDDATRRALADGLTALRRSFD